MLRCSACASLRSWPCRSGRPTAPTNSVSPVKTSQGSSPRVVSVTSRQACAQACPGVDMASTRVLPSATSSPSRSGSKSNSTGASSGSRSWAPVGWASSGARSDGPRGRACRRPVRFEPLPRPPSRCSRPRDLRGDRRHRPHPYWCSRTGTRHTLSGDDEAAEDHLRRRLRVGQVFFEANLRIDDFQFRHSRCARSSPAEAAGRGRAQGLDIRGCGGMPDRPALCDQAPPDSRGGNWREADRTKRSRKQSYGSRAPRISSCGSGLGHARCDAGRAFRPARGRARHAVGGGFHHTRHICAAVDPAVLRRSAPAGGG